MRSAWTQLKDNSYNLKMYTLETSNQEPPWLKNIDTSVSILRVLHEVVQSDSTNLAKLQIAYTATLASYCNLRPYNLFRRI